MSEYINYWYTQEHVHRLRNTFLTKCNDNVYRGSYINWVGLSPSWDIRVVIDVFDHQFPPVLTINDLLNENIEFHLYLTPRYYLVPFLKSNMCISMDTTLTPMPMSNPSRIVSDSHIV